jgi:hypothetical protein
VKAHIYLALTAVFASAVLIARVVFPGNSVLILWNGILAIMFRFAATRARWMWED